MVANSPLAITCIQTGLASQTFVRRHIENILPGGTIVLTDFLAQPQTSFWTVNCPQQAVYGALQAAEPNIGQRIVRAIDRKLLLRVCSRSKLEAIKKTLIESRVQVIMGEFLDISFPWFHVAQDLKIPFFAHAHGGDVHVLSRDPKWRKRYALLKDAAGVITPDQQTLRALLDLGLPESKLHAIPCGIDVPSEPPKHSAGPELRCIAVGRMVVKKGPLITLEAFRQAAQQCPNIRLDFVGSGPLWKECVDFVQKHGLNDQITLHGDQKNERVHSLMKDADLFLQHSIKNTKTGDQEGSPVAIKEAMANALPVISTRHAGIPETVIEAATGFLVDEGDASGMAKHIVALASDAALREKLGYAGWQQVRDHGSWQQECNQLRTLLGLDITQSQ